MRKLAREYTFKLIFEFLFLREYNEDTMLGFLEDAGLNDSDRDYVKEVYFGVSRDFDQIYEKVGTYLQNYKSERIFKPDLAALILACYEIFNRDDIPAAVSVNEAVELCKVFGTEKSPAFVNGILASVLKDVGPEKTGESAAESDKPESEQADGGADKPQTEIESAGGEEDKLEPETERTVAADELQEAADLPEAKA